MTTSLRIIALENLPYNSHIRVGSHHYAQLFSKQNKVLWISLPFHFMQLLRDKNSDRVKNWCFNRPQKISKTLTALTPFAIFPYRNNCLLRSKYYLMNYYKFMPGLLSNVKKTGFGDPDILWFSDPRHLSILKHIKPKKMFYRCVDNLEHFDDIPAGLIEEERSLIRTCDAVFFTAQDLMDKFSGLNRRAYHLPNGCDFKLFNKPDDNPNLVNRIRPFFKTSKLNVLYTGAVAGWFDFNFLRHASKDKRMHFVIVGPIRTTIPHDLKKKENIVFVGPFLTSLCLTFHSLPILRSFRSK